MLYALINGEKVEAEPNKKGICPLCTCFVFAKCGEINVWHWAHSKDQSCDGWYEPETLWHKNWKKVFGKENSEFVIKKDEIKHIADIYTKSEVIIELQNSPIDMPTIRKRETFYGNRMIWIINGIHFKENFNVYKSVFDEDNDEDQYNARFNTSIKFMQVANSYKLNYSFDWIWSRKSWIDAQKHIFIDFGNENLCKVINGMGKRYGICRKVTKQKFLEKYGGDMKLLELLIEKKVDL